MKKLSIITINYNNAQGLRKTIESVVSQENPDYEYIVIDGNSTDDSVVVIEQYADQITYWASESNRGIYGNMNQGIQEATGEYCLFLNSGDWLVPGALNRILPLCKNFDIFYCNTYLSYTITRTKELRYPKELTLFSFYKRNINHQSTLIKTSLFDTYGLYNEKNRVHSDYEFWIKAIIMGNCSCKHLDDFLAYYDMNGISSKPNPSSQAELLKILNTYVPPRILADYQYWLGDNKVSKVIHWLKSKEIW
ncbi:glycosyltransferase family 2 protein [Spirosoma arboris]|nr:glycosyltransferase family 2 protein [Spirosoma arboris]